MNKLLWLSVPFMFFCSETVLAACTQPSTAIFQNTTSTITQFSHNQTVTGGKRNIVSACNPLIRINTYFNATSSDLTGSSPFGVNASTITINGSTADTATLNEAKAWLANNFKIAFNMRDASGASKPATDILNLTNDYKILPETVNRPVVYNTAGVPFFVSTGTGVVVSDIILEKVDISFTNTTKPSAAIIAALNGATLRIHLGTYHYTFATYNDLRVTSEAKSAIEFYNDLTLHFDFPTCTVANQIVNLATVSSGVLNTNQTANEQNFNVNINCAVAMPSKVLLATIKDSYTPSNVNTNGILINQPSLVNRSNVNIQLRDGSDVPLAIGSQSSFYSIPVDSTATTFIKALKARYFRSAPTATSGFVQTQATVSLDYQ
ncbi:fimbrial protein [Acinetobacter guillouiae]|uniref:fimbrial protein n=1 Tax=Acinetobacter guillouiae TaxID=106649 RepID=UPI003AF5B8F9